ncbi:MAG TPA: tripartite tricarboxylate transporter substrate-binding protein [Candidatus Binatia bacterium]|nr:tripartite tricarboxylate transporter substrate-binding protein [Candidatus Binatia bacterium]
MLTRVGLYTVAIVLVIFPDVLRAQDSGFFQGKTVRIIVGTSPGGGFDVYSRALARHMGKYTVGNPNFIVENMPGAGHRIAANHLYKVARPDGLTIGNFFGGLLVGQVLGYSGIEFDAVKFEYIGVPVKDNPVCALTKGSGITSYEGWSAAKAPVKLGATGADDLMLYGIPKILNAVLGLPVQVVAGYKGTSDIRLAAESGELAGGCWGWESIRSTWRKAIESGDVNVVLQTVPKTQPDLVKVPLAIDMAKTDEGRQLIQIGIHNVSAITRPYVLPPGTPKDRVQMLRKALVDTLKDQEFMAEVKKLNFAVDPISGEELEGIIHGLFKMKPETLAKLKEILN